MKIAEFRNLEVGNKVIIGGSSKLKGEIATVNAIPFKATATCVVLDTSIGKKTLNYKCLQLASKGPITKFSKFDKAELQLLVDGLEFKRALMPAAKRKFIDTLIAEALVELGK